MATRWEGVGEIGEKCGAKKKNEENLYERMESGS